MARLGWQVLSPGSALGSFHYAVWPKNKVSVYLWKVLYVAGRGNIATPPKNIYIDLALQNLAARSMPPPLTDGRFQTSVHLKMNFNCKSKPQTEC